MDSLRRQASKLRDQVAKQQQAVIKQLGGTGYESSNVVVIDEVEMQRHQQLEKLYRSTRGGKDFQKDLVKAAEVFMAIGYKHIEAGTKLSEDCCKYGAENNQNINENILAKAAAIYGDARKHVEKEQEDFNRLLSSQVLDPLRAMIIGPPLEDARHLAQRYSRMRQEAEAQASEVSRRQIRVKEVPSHENVAKVHAAEAKMQELKANMAVLGKEAAAALAAVEAQQQRLTFQRFVAMVEGEKNYHLRIAAIFGDVEAEMVSEKQRKESAPPVIPSENCSEKTVYFLAEAMHPFDAASEKELSLVVGDYIVVRKVSPTGWAEGECKGKSGWFPSTYVEKRQRIPTSNGPSGVY
ncbi:hypothetical protein LWI29_006700 [Acer saccharum]|uniref:SH3 domain-containing protein n=1 Tax=Acer saccharum TaxID=4024 RepID=A0AA39VFK4_ACESA|nr:hypothetical protein LWI29_006700 [Acer saccharum]KAK1556342.1 hypothetical protein Q3G72_003219 [Acer saccharum]